MLKHILVAALIALCLLVPGCSTATEQPARPPAAAGMGGGMSSEAGDSGGMVEGFVASESDCVLEMGSGSRVSSDGVSVSRIVAPADGWVVVGSTIAPGRVLGKTWVPKGESRDVPVELTVVDSSRAVVSLHLDRGAPRVYEFDVLRPIRSPDAEVYVSRKPVRSALTLSSFGADALANSALVMVDEQKAGASSVKVAYVMVPGPSWISVTAVSEDAPAKVLGRVWRSAGEYQQISVPVAEGTSPGDVLVTLHEDAGTRDRFEFDPTDPLDSIDLPYRTAGQLAIKELRLTGE